jgi:hypothetical protein
MLTEIVINFCSWIRADAWFFAQSNALVLNWHVFCVTAALG